MSTTVRCSRVDLLESNKHSINILRKRNPALLEKKTCANMSKSVMSNKYEHRSTWIKITIQPR